MKKKFHLEQLLGNPYIPFLAMFGDTIPIALFTYRFSSICVNVGLVSSVVGRNCVVTLNFK